MIYKSLFNFVDSNNFNFGCGFDALLSETVKQPSNL
jgi:hypothetical protein